MQIGSNETICMKCLILFFEENRKKSLKMPSDETQNVNSPVKRDILPQPKTKLQHIFFFFFFFFFFW